MTESLRLQPGSRGELAAVRPAGTDDVVSLADSTARRVAEMIANGTFAAGQRLPPERELAGMLGLSRGSLREALRMLESVGLVQARVGRGRYVSAARVDDPAGGLRIWMQLQPIGDLIAVRRILEPAAIMAIPATRLDGAAAETRRLYTRMHRSLDAHKLQLAAHFHTDFHLALVRYAPSRLHRVLLASMIRGAESAQLEIVRMPGAGVQSLQRHAPMVEALEARDVETCAVLVAEHLTPAFAYTRPTEGEEP